MLLFWGGGRGASRPPEITILNTALRWAVRESESERFYSGPRSNLLNLRALRSCDPSNFRTFFLVITELLRSSKSNYRSIELSVHIRKDTSKMRHAPVFKMMSTPALLLLLLCVCEVREAAPQTLSDVLRELKVLRGMVADQRGNNRGGFQTLFSVLSILGMER